MKPSDETLTLETAGAGFLTDLPGESLPPPRTDRTGESERAALDADTIVRELSPGSELAAALPGFEPRASQQQMARAVTTAFNEQRHLLVEAGTGTGKSLGYLLPAARWAQTNGVPVIISTNTKNLQAQLFEKDIPYLNRALDMPVTASLLKGRSNYVCLRKLRRLLTFPTLDLDRRQRRRMPPVLAWLKKTDTGDLSECLEETSREARTLRRHLTSGGEECAGPSCRFRNRCFLYRARRKAQAADLVIANHALVFAELGRKSPALPPYCHLVFDEAHNLEEAATRHFSREISRIRLDQLLHQLWRDGDHRHPRGLLAMLISQIERGAFALVLNDARQLETIQTALRDTATQVGENADDFFTQLTRLLPGPAHHGTLRLRQDDADRPHNPDFAPAVAGLASSLQTLESRLGAMTELLRGIEGDDRGFLKEFIQEFAALALAFNEYAADLSYVTAATDPDFVFWIERNSDAESARAFAAPCNVGPLLAEELFDAKESIILCSATLTVEQKFSFICKRLGLDTLPPERMLTLNVGSPFDYPRQVSFMVPTYLPEPDRDATGYTHALADMLANLFRATQGRGLVLFTSYRMLNDVTEKLRPQLAEDNIDVLAQGDGASRERLIERFRHDVRSVLMGTHSFWEGVDVVGESLSCVVLARLPFSVFTDPILEARCERITTEGGNAFRDYSLPVAVLRFRQGFGRLIRHCEDRGLILVADGRLISRSYGLRFRRSVPVPPRKFDTPEQLLQSAEQFLQGETGEI